jgi:hypothetical protein
LEIDHVGQEQHKMKEQKAKQSLIGFHADFYLGGCQISPNFEEISTNLETSS